MKLTRENYISIQNLCKRHIIESVEVRIENKNIVTEKFLDVIVNFMAKETAHIGNIHKNKLREIAVGYILEVYGAESFGVDNGIAKR
ncbi:hypothetical protein [Aeromonas phage AS-yj]|uniref:Uncharacterized protein n=5 Tax=Caudoviricetes TaxID=2731619 RepID=A0A291LDQ9_9CAUD|nr:hypothetical protein HWB29_gp255 [Aeromonas phage AS-sw]ATI17471.1 hypothetical protein [Aeromonas phage AS-szw]ATI18040.1 hypothetical protein [Aeromonas phage AS-yj]QAX97911.1 hypothetical protein ASswx1_268 [Aeromonas phage Asswx_1]UKM62539.1 hypothetical protein P19_0051 [Aeromonas phage P19]ATI18305.1 hypothetical protein [Aeromonas phage AS-sw]